MLVTLVLAGAAIASAKSYDVSLGTPAMFGSTQVDSGQYKLSVDGSKVVLVNPNTHKSVEADAKIQNAPKKFAATTVESKNMDGKDVIDKIQLGGTNTEIDLNH